MANRTPWGHRRPATWSLIALVAVFLFLFAVPAFAGLTEASAREEALNRLNQGKPLPLRMLFNAGGLWMYAIAALGLTALVLGIYNWVSLRTAFIAPPELAAQLRQNIQSGDLAAAAALVEGRWSILARAMAAGIRRHASLASDSHISPVERLAGIREAIESAGRRTAVSLRQGIQYLGDIGTIAPIAGLIGTVLGMIEVFQGIAFEIPNARLLSGGVVLALVTTAFGLIVGLLALCVHYFLRGRLTVALAEAESLSEESAQLLSRVTTQQAADAALSSETTDSPSAAT